MCRFGIVCDYSSFSCVRATTLHIAARAGDATRYRKNRHAAAMPRKPTKTEQW